MIWNSIPNSERLHLWKTLRNDIENLSLSDQLIEISKFCSQMPFGSRTLDYYDPINWPTPWEILFYGSFCTSSISLLMYYTLTLLKNNHKDLKLLLVEDERGIYLLPLIDNHIILNYHLGVISIYQEVCDEFKIIKTYLQEDIKPLN